MRHFVAASACALAIALAFPIGGGAKADGYYAPVRTYAPVFTRKLCKAPPRRLFNRGQVSWVCSASQKCCYDWLLRKGTCVAATDRCF